MKLKERPFFLFHEAHKLPGDGWVLDSWTSSILQNFTQLEEKEKKKQLIRITDFLKNQTIWEGKILGVELSYVDRIGFVLVVCNHSDRSRVDSREREREGKEIVKLRLQRKKEFFFYSIGYFNIKSKPFFFIQRVLDDNIILITDKLYILYFFSHI